jgi:hypothetical protein
MGLRLSLYHRWLRFQRIGLTYPLAQCAGCGAGAVAIWWLATYG